MSSIRALELQSARERLAMSAPRFKTPPGVTLRPLAAGEENKSPVLVCADRCGPQLHYEFGDDDRVWRWRCCICGKGRIWG